MSGRAAPGRRVGAGSLRVDAARAVAKLRDYQLPVPEMWVLELIRAAVVMGATEIDAYGDSDDVRIAFRCEPPPTEDLTRLLDELVNPASDEKRRHLRLMATAVNTALGLSPRYLDVIACRSAAAERVRFSPEILEVDEDEPFAESHRMRSLEAEPVPRPLDAPPTGLVVHLRRPPDLAVLRNLVTGREPAELRLIRECCDDSRVPIRLGSGVLTRERSHRDLIRVPLGPDLDGFVALTWVGAEFGRPRPEGGVETGSPVVFEACERGVLMARYPIDLGFDLRGVSPLRVVLDADRLPANASRSGVRRGEQPLALAGERAVVAFTELAKRIAVELSPDAEGTWVGRTRDALLRSALSLVASISTRSGTNDVRDHVPMLRQSPLADLLALPLLRDAFGRPLSLEAMAARKERDDFIHRGPEALPSELEHWLADVIWVPPGDPAEVLICEGADAAERVVAAHASLEAQKRYLHHLKHRGGVPEAEGQWLVGSLEALRRSTDSTIVDGFFADALLEGELCLQGPGSASMATYLYDGRMLARRRLDAAVPFTAVVSSPLIRPNADFTSVEQGHDFEAVERCLRGASVRLAEGLARRLLRERGRKAANGTVRGEWIDSRSRREESAELRLVLRRAAVEAMAVVGEHRLGGPLARAPIWPVATRDGSLAYASLEELAASARKDAGTMFVAHEAAVGRLNPGLPEGRLALAVSAVEELLVREHLQRHGVGEKGGPRRVGYSRAQLTTTHSPQDLRQELVKVLGAALKFETQDGYGAIGFATKNSIVDYRHLGRRVARRKSAGTTGACWILFEVPELVPAPGHEGIAKGEPAGDFADAERALLRAVGRALVGEAVPELQGAPAIRERGFVPFFFERLASAGGREALGAKLWRALREAPLFDVAFGTRRRSLDELDAASAGFLHWVPTGHRIDFDPGEFQPLQGPASLAKALAQLLGKKPKNAIAELRRRQKLARRRARLEKHREQAPVPEPPIEGEHRLVDFPNAAPVTPRVRVALPDGQEQAPALLRVLIDDRPFQTRSLPGGAPVFVTARLSATAADSKFEGLTKKALGRLEKLVDGAVPALVSSIARAAPETLLRDDDVRRVLDHMLGRDDGPLREEFDALVAVGRAQIFMSVQGDKVGAMEALRRSKVYVASYVGMWIGPDDGEPTHGLDAPVLRIEEGEAGQRQVRFIEGVAGHETTDVTRGCEQLQARRRVARGLLPKPTLHHHAGVSHVHDVATLVGSDRKLRRALGPGEIGLSPTGPSRVSVYRDGRYVGVVEVNAEPPVLVTLESPTIPEDITNKAGTASLERRIQKLVDRLVERLVADGGVGDLEAAVKRRIRSAMLGDLVLADWPGADELPLYETTSGRWLPETELIAQFHRFDDIWYVEDFASEAVPLREGRHVFRLSSADALWLAGDGIVAIEASRELALDMKARRNQDRPALAELALGYGEQRAALGVEALAGKGELALEGLVAPLRPGAEAHRGLRSSMGRRPLGEHADPCGWPTRSIVDSPHLVPNRTWSGADEEDRSYEEICRAVRRASEKAFRKLSPIPGDAIEPRRVSSSDCRALRLEVPVRGALWAAPGDTPMSVRVVDGDGARELRPTERGTHLPLGGILYVDGPETSSAAEDVARLVYGRMLKSMVRRLANEWQPTMAAHVVHGFAIGALDADDLGDDVGWPLGVGGPLDPATVSRWISPHHGLVWVVKPEEVAAARQAFEGRPGGPTVEDPWLIDDGSVAARTILHYLGWRARHWPPPPEAMGLPATALTGQEFFPVDQATVEGLTVEALLPRPPALPPMDFDEVSAEPAVVDAPEAQLPPPEDLSHHLARRVAATGLELTVSLEARKRSRMVQRRERGDYRVSAHHPVVRRLRAALEAEDPRAKAALSLLAAQLIGEANRARDDVTDEHELDAMVTLLGTRV